MTRTIEKVTSFVTRRTPNGLELLLFEHPTAGIQIPAGTVNPGETPAQAARREVAEETGLTDLSSAQYLGAVLEKLPDDQRVIAEHTRIYAHPDSSSFDWAYLRPGITVAVERTAGGFTQIHYVEFDQVPDPGYVSMSIKGWVPDVVLAQYRRRHFYHLEFVGLSEPRWQTFADQHLFTPFWAPWNALPKIIAPQDQWLAVLKDRLNRDQDP